VQPGMGFDLQQMWLQAQQMQESLVQAQQQLADAQVTGTAGGGVVTATLTGAGELVAVEIRPEAVDLDDLETLGDLIVAAVRDAKRAADELTEDAMRPVTGGLGQFGGGLGFPELPGMPG
jgi:nucleoid-associated protein EbfC